MNNSILFNIEWKTNISERLKEKEPASILRFYGFLKLNDIK